MRIVLDTNVVFSALLWRGAPYRLLASAREQEHLQLFTSTALVLELTRVLMRPAATQRLDALGIDIETVLFQYVAATKLVTPASVPPISTDPDDDQVIGTALAARADILISGDQDLLRVGAYRDIRIVTPATALALIESA